MGLTLTDVCRLIDGDKDMPLSKTCRQRFENGLAIVALECVHELDVAEPYDQRVGVIIARRQLAESLTVSPRLLKERAKRIYTEYIRLQFVAGIDLVALQDDRLDDITILDFCRVTQDRHVAWCLLQDGHMVVPDEIDPAPNLVEEIIDGSYEEAQSRLELSEASEANIDVISLEQAVANAD